MGADLGAWANHPDHHCECGEVAHFSMRFRKWGEHYVTACTACGKVLLDGNEVAVIEPSPPMVRATAGPDEVWP